MKKYRCLSQQPSKTIQNCDVKGYAFQHALCTAGAQYNVRTHPVNKVYMGGENLRLLANCLYGYVLENFELSHR